MKNEHTDETRLINVGWAPRFVLTQSAKDN